MRQRHRVAIALIAGSLLAAGAAGQVPVQPTNAVKAAASVAVTVGSGGEVVWQGGKCTGGPGSLPGQCEALVATGKPVTFEARPAAGKRLAGWTGACKGQGARCQITLSAASAAIGAGFEDIPGASAPGKPVFLSVNVPDYGGRVTGAAFGSVKIDCAKQISGPVMAWCSADVPAGQKVTLVATAEAGGTFLGFSSDFPGCQGATCTFVMAPEKKSAVGDAAVVTARFAPPPFRTLTLQVPKSSPGNIWSFFANGELLPCSAGTCVLRTPPGKVVKLTGLISQGNFMPKVTDVTGAMWQGACAGTASTTCTVKLDEDKAVTVKQ